MTLSLCLSGCNELSNTGGSEKHKFIGKWKGGEDIGYGPLEDTIIIFLNDSFSTSDRNRFNSSGKWEIIDGQLVMVDNTTTTIQTFNYSFSNGDTKLVLTDINTNTTKILTKQ
jgi:hypothetical protein